MTSQEFTKPNREQTVARPRAVHAIATALLCEITCGDGELT
jgi:hypothetical protein